MGGLERQIERLGLRLIVDGKLYVLFRGDEVIARAGSRTQIRRRVWDEERRADAATALERTRTVPIDKIRSYEFATLRVDGRDEYSELRLPELRRRYPQESEQIRTCWSEPEQAVILRWMCR